MADAPQSTPSGSSSGVGGRIVILSRHLFHYRVPFFVELDRLLKQSGLCLQVVYGTRDREDFDAYGWAVRRPNNVLTLGGRELLWQPALDLVRGADLVIVEQASRLILNYYLAVKQKLGWNRLAFWGHGKNFQATKANDLAELVKKRLSVNAHWWFAYNGLTRSIVESLGFPSERITDVQNAIDTSRLQELMGAIGVEDRERILRQNGLDGSNIGIYCGSMYPDKRLGFLIAAAQKIRARVSDFELVMVGSGPDQHLAEEAAAARPWIRYVGPKYDKEKVELFSVSKVFLMPGLVGLAILDAFALRTPIVTTTFPRHSPEIHYLRSKFNGLMTDDALTAYVDGVVEVLERPELLDTLRTNAYEASRFYTIENMARNFQRGILAALEKPEPLSLLRANSQG